MPIKITIDQGHVEGYNVGCAKGYAEGTAMFHLGMHLKAELEKYEGFIVSLTRTALKQNPTLEQRGKIAVENDCEVFLSLHSNAFSSATASGVVNFYSLKHPSSKALCDQLGNAITELMVKDTGNTHYRGSQTRAYPNTTKTDYYGVIRHSVKGATVKASFLIEHGFHTNKKECDWLNDDANLRKLAKREAEVLASYYGAKLIENAPNQEDEPLLQEAINIVQEKTGFSEATMTFLLCYKYGEELVKKIAKIIV